MFNSRTLQAYNEKLITYNFFCITKTFLFPYSSRGLGKDGKSKIIRLRGWLNFQILRL